MTIDWNNFFPKDIYSKEEIELFILQLSSSLSLSKNQKINLLKGMPKFEPAQLDMIRVVLNEEAVESTDLKIDKERLQLVQQEWQEIVHLFETTHALTPHSLFQYLRKTIIGQDRVLGSLSSLLFLHHRKHEKRAQNLQSISPVLLAGPTGSGKTAMVRYAAQYLQMPFVHVDCSNMTAEGYVGYGPSDVVKQVLREADYDLQRAERAIVFLDEFDKLLLKEGVIGSLNQLLRMIEGHHMPVSKDRSDHEEFKRFTHIDTTHMLFVLAGSFEHILAEKRQNCSGFLPQNDSNSDLTFDDLAHAGFSRELMGRIKKVYFLRALDEEDFYRLISQSSESPVQKYLQTLEELYGIQVEVSDHVLKHIAHEASGSPYGVRRLAQMTHEMFESIMFNAPGSSQKQFQINLEDLQKGGYYV